MDELKHMYWQHTPYTVPLFLTGAFSAFLALYMWRKRQTPATLWLVDLFAAVAAWTLGYAMEMASAMREAKEFWAAFQYMGIVAVPVLWFGLVLEYTGRGRWLGRSAIAGLSAIPLMTAALAWTHDYHNVLRRAVEMVAVDTYSVLIVAEYGPWFWIHVGYCYVLLGLGSILLLPALFRSPHLYRRQIFVMLVGLVAPWAANVIYLFGLSPFPHLDLTPFSFIILALACALGLFRFQLIDIAPIARHLVVEGLRDGVITLDPQDRIVDVNPVAQHIFGRSADQLVGRPAADILVDVSGLQFPMRGDDLSEEMVFERDGESLTYELRVTVLREREQDLPGHVIVCHDITERKRTEAEMVRAQRLRAAGELSLGVSHNLNNILTGILGPAQKLRQAAGEAESTSQLDTIISSALRARDLIQRLSRSVEGEESDPSRVTLERSVEEAVEAARPRWQDEARANGREIEVTMDLESVPPVAADPTGLHDLMLNLIFNAVDAMPDGGRIHFGTHAANGVVRLSVDDSGSGMDEATMARIFEPFFTTKADVGTGLGLSTAYATVNRWGGSIGVESTPGVGTKFVIELPVWSGPDAEPAVERFEQVCQRPASPARILIAEDEGIVRMTLITDLEDAGHEVVAAVDGVSALERFDSGRFDVAIIDMGLPGLTGDELASRLRQRDPSLVTVLISGWNLGEGDSRLRAFDFYLRKPFGPDELQRVIGQAAALRVARMKAP